jgi:hypothetical protein
MALSLSFWNKGTFLGTTIGLINSKWRNNLIIVNEPRNGAYHKLIDIAFEICDEFILVVRPYAIINDNTKLLLRRLEPNLIIVKEQTEWPYTITRGDPSQVYYFKTNDKTKKIIKEAANSLYAWQPPDLPDDLTFFKKGKAWLTNTAHEEQSSIETQDEEEIKRIMSIDGLKVKL